MAEEDHSALKIKIENYSAQLQQVNTILQSDPNNEQFIKIRDDLHKVIKLTSDLIQYQNVPDEETEENAYNQTNASRSLNNNSDSNTAAAEVEEDFDDDGDDDDNNNLDLAATFIQPTGIIQVGEVVEVIGGDRPYAGVVTSILNESEYRVKYFEYETEVTLPITSLTRIPPGTLLKEEVVVGFRGQCKFSQDQLYYDCVVQQITDHGAIVLYPQYGNSEEVPIAYIRPLIQKQKKEKSEQSLIKIPENLKILPTDTEEEKLRKKKKIKAIKSKNRIVTKELEVAAVQQSWKKFVTKAAKRPINGIVKNSIFTSPDEIEGKVGVTNSGKGLTDFGQRKRHKF